jgi:hypothetical protein
MNTKRTCDSCTECCKGWLHGSAYGHDFYRGKQCFFLLKNCTIYDNRPENPCKSYKCHWLASEDLPMWMRPDLSNVIVTKRQNNNIEYYEIIECGKKLDSSVLSWFIQWAFTTRKNLVYQIDGGYNKIGSKEFLALKW